MKIVYSANENYAQHLAVSMCSLYDRNADSDSIETYVISTGISEESKQKLKSIAEKYGRDLTFINLEDISNRLDYDPELKLYNISILSRFFLGECLPESVDRVLYLDADTVVLQSLERLYHTRLDGTMMGAVMEPTIYEETKEIIGLDSTWPYYNSGVMLIDMEAWRLNEVDQKLRDYYKTIAGKSLFADQDAINGVLKGRIKSLSPRYNFFSNYRYFRYEDLVSYSPLYAAVSKKEFESAKRHPFILHFAGDDRPWIRGCTNFYKTAYEKYLEYTPWKGTPKQSGKELYLTAYGIMNRLTTVYPPIRKAISKKYSEKIHNE